MRKECEQHYTPARDNQYRSTARYYADNCPYCEIDRLTTQLADQSKDANEWDRHLTDLNEDNRQLRTQLAERDAEIVRLKESEEVLTDCLNGSSKAMYTAEMYDKLRTENAALREEVERLRHDLDYCGTPKEISEVRKQTAQECLEILNRCTLHNDMSFAYAQIIHTFGLEW